MPDGGGDYRFKLVLIGEPGVGKTSLIGRYMSNTFGGEYIKTLGTTISKWAEKVEFEDGRSFDVSLVIWDIMGERTILPLLQDAYFHKAQGALAVFDVTRRETLKGLKEWITAAWRTVPKMPIVILGNKADLVVERVVADEEAWDFWRPLGLPYFASSARTGQNVEMAFKLLAQEILRGVLAPRVTAEELDLGVS
jgi:Ras-related protein Rab-2A